MRSHPPALLRLVERTLREECELEPGERLVLGVSGGPDSMALLHVLARLRERLGFELVACGVDHGLRSEAPGELELAARFAASLDVRFVSRAVVVPPGGNLQARARERRYRAFNDCVSEVGGRRVVTAHHLDDRAETVLIRLLSGSGARGLAVLPARDGDLLRPMIRARRSQVLAHVERHGVPCVEDPSNRDPRFLRTRVRQELLPLLESLSPKIVEHLAVLADEIDAPELPQLRDEGGRVVALGRAQRTELRRALRHQQRAARVLISDGRVVVVDPRNGQPRLLPVEAECPSYREKVSKRRPMGLKTPKSD